MRGFLALLGGLASACTAIDYRIGEPLAFEALEELVETQADVELSSVLRTMGPPILVGSYEESMLLLYEYVRLDEDQLGFGLDLLLTFGFAELLKFSYGSSGSDRDAVLLVFDEHRRLREVATTEWREDFGRSGGLQIIGTVKDVVDSTALRAPLRVLDWGAWRLESLTEGLSLESRPHIRLRGTRPPTPTEIDR